MSVLLLGKNKTVKGPLLMLGAAALSTVMSVVVKLMPSQYTVWHIGFIRCFGGMVTLLFVSGVKKNPYIGHNIPILIFRGLTGCAAFMCAITAVRILPISTATVIFYSFPVFASIFSFLIYKEPLSIPQVFCMLTVFCGIAILFDFKFDGNMHGQVMAITGGIFAGLTVTLIRSLRQKNGPVIIYLYFCTLGSILTFPICCITPVLPVTLVEWMMIAIIILASVCAQLLMNQGFFYCKGYEGAIYMSSETVFTAIIGISFLGDPATVKFFAGAALIIASGILLNRFNVEKKI